MEAPSFSISRQFSHHRLLLAARLRRHVCHAPVPGERQFLRPIKSTFFAHVTFRRLIKLNICTFVPHGVMLLLLLLLPCFLCGAIIVQFSS